MQHLHRKAFLETLQIFVKVIDCQIRESAISSLFTEIKKFLTWEVSKWQFDPRVIITGWGAGWRGGNALPAKSFGSAVILCTPTLYKGMYILQRESIYSYLSFLELCSIAVSLLQGLINMNSTMMIMSLPIISS